MLINMKQVRARLGLRVDDMARLCDVDTGLWRLYEEGVRYPDTGTLRVVGLLCLCQQLKSDPELCRARSVMAGMDSFESDDDMLLVIGRLVGLLDWVLTLGDVDVGVLTADTEMKAAVAGLSGEVWAGRCEPSLAAAKVLKHLYMLGVGSRGVLDD